MSGSFTDERRQRATRSAAWTAVAVAGCAVLFGIPAPTHWGAPGVRAAIETLIATAAIISATLLLLSYREHRRLSDLLLLTALATVGVTDFVFSALPALTGSEALGLGSGPQVACDALAAVAFAAAALVPSHRLDRAGHDRLDQQRGMSRRRGDARMRRDPVEPRVTDPAIDQGGQQDG